MPHPPGANRKWLISRGRREVTGVSALEAMRLTTALSPSGTQVTHKGLIQVCHLLLELWGPDVGVGHAHHNHTPREGGGTQDNGTCDPQGPGQRARSSPTCHQLLRLSLLQPSSCAQWFYLSLPILYLPPRKGCFG